LLQHQQLLQLLQLLVTEKFQPKATWECCSDKWSKECPEMN